MNTATSFPYLRPHQLKEKLQTLRPDSHFFDRDAMRHTGDTMANYGVRPCRMMPVRSLEPVDAEGGRDYLRRVRPVYELYRRKATRKGQTESVFFDAETMKVVKLWED